MSLTYVVLGATGGVGSAVVRLLTDSGHAVHMIAKDQNKLEEMADQTGATSFSTCDAKYPETVAAAMEAVNDKPLAGLVYAIGTVDLKPLNRITSTDMTHAFTINVTSAMAAIQAATTPLKQGKGSIILYSSIAAGTGFSNHAITGTIKAAVEGLSRTLAAELSPDIRVNTLAPSLLDTPMSRDILSSRAVSEAIAKSHPLGRFGSPDDVAHMTRALLSPDTWVTGQIIGIDGGRSSIAGR